MTLAADVTGSTSWPGRPPAIVLLHGQAGSAADWAPVVARLPAVVPGHAVIVPHRLGYGRTGGRGGGFSANADAVIGLLDELDVGRAVVAGHSWGAGVALDLAERRPERLAGAVLVAPVVPGDPPGRLDRLLAVRAMGPAVAAVALGGAARLLTWPPALRAAGRHWPSDEHLRATAESWRRRESWHSFAVEQRALVSELVGLAPGLRAIRVPVTVVVGTADRVIPPAGAARLAEVVPGATLVRLGGVGHHVMLERPDTVVSAIARLARAAAPSG